MDQIPDLDLDHLRNGPLERTSVDFHIVMMHLVSKKVISLSAPGVLEMIIFGSIISNSKPFQSLLFSWRSVNGSMSILEFRTLQSRACRLFDDLHLPHVSGFEQEKNLSLKGCNISWMSFKVITFSLAVTKVQKAAWLHSAEQLVEFKTVF